MFSGLFLTVLLKMFSFCWAKCVPLKACAVKNSSSISGTAVISVSTAGGGDSVWWSKGGVLCGVHCEWIPPTFSCAPAHQRWGLAVEIEEESTLLATAYEHFAKPFHSGIIVCIKEKSKASVLALFPKPIEVFIRIGLQGTSLMFSKF